MARRFERHSRRKYDDWSAVPSRSAERAAAIAEAPAKPRARKDSRRWCKGVAGREHAPEILHEPQYPGRRCGRAEAWWRSACRDGWACEHRERCSACGRVIRDRHELGRECPGYPAET